MYVFRRGNYQVILKRKQEGNPQLYWLRGPFDTASGSRAVKPETGERLTPRLEIGVASPFHARRSTDAGPWGRIFFGVVRDRRSSFRFYGPFLAFFFLNGGGSIFWGGIFCGVIFFVWGGRCALHTLSNQHCKLQMFCRYGRWSQSFGFEE